MALLKAAQVVLGLTGSAAPRLVHAGPRDDGTLDCAAVLEDCRAAAACVHPDGVIAVAGTFSIDRPAVTEALLAHARENPRFVPFLLAPGMTYLCAPAHAERYLRHVLPHLPDVGTIRRRALLGTSVMVVAPGEMPSDGPYAGAARYIDVTMDEVHGYLDPGNAKLFLMLDFAQAGHGLTGDLAEIGVYRGRATILLAKLLRVAETLIAVDVFETYGQTPPFNLVAPFLHNCRRRGVPMERLRMAAVDTLRAPEKALQALGRGRVRFIHVDGGHKDETVRSDCRIAAEATHPDGIIAFDDMFSDMDPEVTPAVLAHFAADRRFAPLLVAPNKAYFCAPRMRMHYLRYLLPFLPGARSRAPMRLLDVDVPAARLDDEPSIEHLMALPSLSGPEAATLHARLQRLGAQSSQGA
ncbi:MAG: class I SAM-dependent methyltransferase [Alphaproteobacteria bacterium]|nr:class I SAM-dependent methyltransferase [Alphaproteobacteria bacterium]